jgi:hypothetical protein
VRREEDCTAAALGVGTMIKLIVMLGATIDVGKQLIIGGTYMMLRTRDTGGSTER